MTKTVNVHEAKTHLSRLLDEAIAGEDIVIAKAGKPKVRLVPVEDPLKRELHFMEGWDVADEAFFEPLPEAELSAWGGPLLRLLEDTHALLWAADEAAASYGQIARTQLGDDRGPVPNHGLGPRQVTMAVLVAASLPAGSRPIIAIRSIGCSPRRRSSRGPISSPPIRR